jgi:hypothetical protein
MFGLFRRKNTVGHGYLTIRQINADPELKARLRKKWTDNEEVWDEKIGDYVSRTTLQDHTSDSGAPQ